MAARKKKTEALPQDRVSPNIITTPKKVLEVLDDFGAKQIESVNGFELFELVLKSTGGQMVKRYAIVATDGRVSWNTVPDPRSAFPVPSWISGRLQD